LCSGALKADEQIVSGSDNIVTAFLGVLRRKHRKKLIVKALSAESVLTNCVWTAAPAITVWLALSITASGPLLLAAVLMAAAAAGTRAMPAGRETGSGDREGTSTTRALARAWPIYLTGSAAMSLLALAELALPALLGERAIGVGWAGPLLAGFSAASALGAVLYGTRRSWPATCHCARRCHQACTQPGTR
jgi:hypothetical protein